MKKYIENKETRKLQKVLNFKEVRSGRFDLGVSPGAISNFKTGITNKLSEDLFIKLKSEINILHLTLVNFSKLEVKASNDYFTALLDLAETKQLNWQEIVRNVSSDEKPNTASLRWSLYSEFRKPNVELIEKYYNFFEQLRFEIKSVASKIKI